MLKLANWNYRIAPSPDFYLENESRLRGRIKVTKLGFLIFFLSFILPAEWEPPPWNWLWPWRTRPASRPDWSGAHGVPRCSPPDTWTKGPPSLSSSPWSAGAAPRTAGRPQRGPTAETCWHKNKTEKINTNTCFSVKGNHAKNKWGKKPKIKIFFFHSSIYGRKKKHMIYFFRQSGSRQK